MAEKRTRRSLRQQAAQFIDSEAGQSGGPATDDAEEQAAADAIGSQGSSSFIVPDEQASQSSASAYRAHMSEELTQQLRALSSAPRPAAAPGPKPYFPRAFSVPGDPLEFDFDLYALDTLRFSHGLFSDDCDRPVSFCDVQQCRAYCLKFGESMPPPPQEEAVADKMDKKAMFWNTGMALNIILETGDPCFDTNIQNARRDRWGNVMVLGAPSWSDLAPQLMHGFPRARCPPSHGGLLRGNITVAARVTNQVARSVCLADIACLCSETTMQGLGLTVSELFLARQSAIKYYQQEKQPSRLVAAMVRYGVDFSSMTALRHGQLEALIGSSAQVHKQQLEVLSTSDDSEADSADERQEDGLEAEVPVDLRSMRPPNLASPQRQPQQLEACSVELMLRFVTCGQNAPAPAEQPFPNTEDTEDGGPPGQEAAPRAPARRTRVGGAGRKRKRSRRGPDQEDAPVPGDVGPTTMRQKLATFPSVNMVRVPERSTLNRMAQFLEQNEPISQEAIIAERQRQPGSEGLPEASLRVHSARREERVDELLRSLWNLEKSACQCSGESQETCPYLWAETSAADVRVWEARCTNAECPVCLFFSEFPMLRERAIQFPGNKTQRMQFLLAIAPRLTQLMWHPDVQTSYSWRDNLKKIWMELLSCSEDKLQAVVNVGHLVQVLPNLKHVCLRSGWSKFWPELRKLGAALGYQHDDRAKHAVLYYVRSEFVPDNNWKALLTGAPEAENEAAEFFASASTDAAEGATPSSPSSPEVG